MNPRAFDRNPAFWLSLPDTRAWLAGEVAEMTIHAGQVYVRGQRIGCYDYRLDVRCLGQSGEDAAKAVARAEKVAAAAREWIAAGEQPEPPKVEEEDEETETRQIPLQSMAALVFGAPKPKRVRLPARLIFIVAFAASAWGCATGRPAAADQPESVGTLAPSYNSIATAPVHKTTDLSPAFQAVEGDDSATETVTTVSQGDAGRADAAELPEVAPKTDGVTTGTVR